MFESDSHIGPAISLHMFVKPCATQWPVAPSTSTTVG